MADEGKLPLKDLQEQFKDIYDEEIEEEQLKNDLNDLVELTKTVCSSEVLSHRDVRKKIVRAFLIEEQNLVNLLTLKAKAKSI